MSVMAVYTLPRCHHPCTVQCDGRLFTQQLMGRIGRSLEVT